MRRKPANPKKNKQPLRFVLLERWGRWAAGHWVRALIISLVITIVVGAGAGFLSLDMTFFSILPEQDPRVKDLKTIVAEYPASSSIAVVVEALDKTNRQQAKETVKNVVDALDREFEQSRYSEYIAYVYAKLDKKFFEHHGLMLTESEDIERLTRIFQDLSLEPFIRSLNDDLEREYSANEEKLSDDESMAVAQFEGLETLLTGMRESVTGQGVDRETLSRGLDTFLFGDPYFLNRDHTMAVVMIQPTFSIDDLDVLMQGIPLIESRSKEIAAGLGASAGITGIVVIARDEMVTAEKGLEISMAVAFLLVLVLMILKFRMYTVPLITGIPLAVGIIWTAGMAGFFIRRLNLLTAMYMVALIGLGIDYAIHLLTTYIQERDDGKNFLDAMGAAFRKSGWGVIMGALTTAVAFLMLMTARMRMVQELGFVAGVGILCELAAMFLFVPGLLGFRDYLMRKRNRKEPAVLRRMTRSVNLLPGLSKSVKKIPYAFVLLCILVSAALIPFAMRVTIEDNMMEMEAKGLESIELQDRMVEEFGMAPDALFITSTDLEETRRVTVGAEKLASVKAVESITPYLPSVEEAARRMPLIESFRAGLAFPEVESGTESLNEPIDEGAFTRLKDELDRLDMNFLEIGQLAWAGGMDRMTATLDRMTGQDGASDPVIPGIIDELESRAGTRQSLGEYQAVFASLLREKLLRMAGTDPILPGNLPESVRRNYLSRDGERYLILVIPTQNAWEGRFRSILQDQLATVTDGAVGMVMASDALTAIAEVDGLRAAGTALAAIFLILLLDFRNLKMALLTVLPLGLAFVSLLGIMGIAGIKFDFINIIAIPLLIGIGIDDAVHIGHRYLLEGKCGMGRVINKTGAAILMTSVTTIIGFASFIPSVMRAMRSTGIVLSIAIALAFLYSVFFHTAILVVIREKWGLKIRPWKGGNNDDV